jgi:hypothetical protein
VGSRPLVNFCSGIHHFESVKSCLFNWLFYKMFHLFNIIFFVQNLFNIIIYEFLIFGSNEFLFISIKIKKFIRIFCQFFVKSNF